MKKTEAARIAINCLYMFVDSADYWDDPDYQDYVEALKAYGITKSHPPK